MYKHIEFLILGLWTIFQIITLFFIFVTNQRVLIQNICGLEHNLKICKTRQENAERP